MPQLNQLPRLARCRAGGIQATAGLVARIASGSSPNLVLLPATQQDRANTALHHRKERVTTLSIEVYFRIDSCIKIPVISCVHGKMKIVHPYWKQCGTGHFCTSLSHTCVSTAAHARWIESGPTCNLLPRDDDNWGVINFEAEILPQESSSLLMRGEANALQFFRDCSAFPDRSPPPNLSVLRNSLSRESSMVSQLL